MAGEQSRHDEQPDRYRDCDVEPIHSVDLSSMLRAQRSAHINASG